MSDHRRHPRNKRKRPQSKTTLLQGDGEDTPADWGESCARSLRHRFRQRLAQPTDGRRPQQAPTRQRAPPVTDEEDWTAVMVTDCGYERVPKQDTWGSSNSGGPEWAERLTKMRSDACVWMTGRDEQGRSVCIWVHRPVPYFYVGISHPDPAHAQHNAPRYAASLKAWLESQAETMVKQDEQRGSASIQSLESWSRRRPVSVPKVLEVRPVKRRWLYGYRPSYTVDKQQPDWGPGLGLADDGSEPIEQPWAGTSTQASDWYLKVCAAAPYHVNKLRIWAADWVQYMGNAEERPDSAIRDDLWVPPVVRTTSTIQAPVNLTIFEANVEFALRFMVDRGMVGCGWVALNRKASRRQGLLASYGPGDGKDQGKRSRCDYEYVVDSEHLERAEWMRDRVMLRDMDPMEYAPADQLEGYALRFVAREAELQKHVDGHGPGANKLRIELVRARLRSARERMASYGRSGFTPPMHYPPCPGDYPDWDTDRPQEIEAHRLAVVEDEERRMTHLEESRQWTEKDVLEQERALEREIARGKDPMERWFQDLRQATSPLRIMTFDIECCNEGGSFPEPDKDDGQVINVAARLYRLDRVEAYERRQDVAKRLREALGELNRDGGWLRTVVDMSEHDREVAVREYGEKKRQELEQGVQQCHAELEALGFGEVEGDIRAAHLRKVRANLRGYQRGLQDFEDYVGKTRAAGHFPCIQEHELRGLDAVHQRIASERAVDHGRALLRGSIARAKEEGRKVQRSNGTTDLSPGKWSPPLDSVVLGLGKRDGLEDGGMDGYPVTTLSFGSEPEMLIALGKLIVEWDPDIIEGYNSIAFDMAYLLRRAKHLEIEKVFWDLGRLPGRLSKPKEQKFGNKAKGRRKEYRAKLHGRAQFDIYRVCDSDIAYSPRSYRLDDVAKDLLGEGKTGLKYAQIPEKHHGSPATRRELDEYCDADAALPFKIERHQSYLMRYIELARVTGVPLDFLLTKGQQVLVFSQLLRKARQEGYAVPYLPVVEPERSLTEARKTKAYQGAVVIEPKAGFYTVHQHGPVVVNDYKSLYPMSMISQNLGYCTHITDPAAAEACRRLHAERKVEHDDRKTQEDRWYDGDLKVRDYEVKGGWKVAPVNSKNGRPDPVFVRPEVRKSLIAMILEELLAARSRAKKEMYKYPKGSPPFKVQRSREMAIKVCCNSVYGFTGAPVGRQPDLDISGATTGYGRCALYFAQRLAEKLLPGDNEVVYGDTDSVMILVKDACTHEQPEPGKPLSEAAVAAVAKAFERGKLLDKEVNSRLLPPMELETEKVYSPFLLLGKKKYLTLMWMKPDAPFDTDAKGIEMVRRDNPQIVGMACKTFAKLVMGRGPKIEGKRDQRQGLWPDLETGKELLRQVHRRMLCDELPQEAYVISGKFGKPPKEYDNIPAHVALAMRMQRRDPGSAPQLGNRIPYVVVTPECTEAVRNHEKCVLWKNDKRGVKVRDCSEDPDWAQEHGMQIDTEYYARKKFEPPFLRMLAPVMAARELAQANPKDPRMWVRQKRLYRDQPEKLQKWIQKKRQEAAEGVVRSHVFADNYRKRKVRRRLQPGGALESAFGVSSEGPPHKRARTSEAGEERTTAGPRQDDDDDDTLRPGDRPEVDEDARKRIKGLLRKMLAEARKEMEKRGEVAGGTRPRKRARKTQSSLTAFFASAAASSSSSQN